MGSIDRSLDNRWNQAVDRLCEAWDVHGPDVTLAWLSALARSEVTAEGVAVVEIAPRGGEVG
jgi:hypothetical protein